MAANTMRLPKGFVLDSNQPKAPKGFVLDKKSTDGGAGRLGGIISEPIDPQERAEFERQEQLQARIAAGEIESVPPTYWEKLKGELPQMAGGTAG